MLLVSVALAARPTCWRGLRKLSRRLLFAYAGIGVLVALHWLTFYGAIKLANASVAATCIALGPVFLALVEPWISGRRFDPRELMLGIAVVPGVALVVGGLPSGMHLGVAVGIASAFLVALFGSWNKRLVERADSITVTFVELTAGTAFLGAIMLALALTGVLPEAESAALPGSRDLALLLVLALVCTLLPFALSLVALRKLTAFQGGWRSP